MMAPALFLANFSPVGPAVEIALLGEATILLMWFVSKKWFGKYAAVVSSLLYAISPVVIYHSRSSWNPNIMPLFSLILIFSLWKIWNERSWNWLIIAGVSFSFVIQSHYLGLILLPTIFLFYVVSLLRDYKNESLRKMILKNTLWATGIVLTLMSSLLVFDARYGWRNALAMKGFFTQNRTDISFSITNNISRLTDITVEFFTRIIGGKESFFGSWALVGVIFLSFFSVYRWKNISTLSRKALILIGTWMVLGIMGLSLYKQHIFDHYYGFMFPAPFIFLGGLINIVAENKNKAYFFIVSTLILAPLVCANIRSNAFWTEPNRQLARTEAVSRKIVTEANNEKYNLAVIAERNYEGAYQYFMDLWHAPMVIIDPQKADDTITDQLFVVCEYEDITKCQPTSNPKAEVANFGWSKIDKEWRVDGIKIFKLVHSK